jgi:hypothetical protein
VRRLVGRRWHRDRGWAREQQRRQLGARSGLRQRGYSNADGKQGRQSLGSMHLSLLVTFDPRRLE